MKIIQLSENRDQSRQLFPLDWSRGKKFKRKKVVGKKWGGGEGGERRERRKEGGERGDKRFIKVKQLWTTAKVVSTNSVCLFLDLTDWNVSRINPRLDDLPSQEINERVSFVTFKSGMYHSCLTE